MRIRGSPSRVLALSAAVSGLALIRCAHGQTAVAPETPSLYALYGWAGTYVKYADDVQQLGIRWVRAGGWHRRDDADQAALLAARHGIVLTPTLLLQDISYGKTLPVEEALLRWRALVRENVLRYGPNGELWKEHPNAPALPIRHWQVWNEPNIDFLTPTEPMLRTELYARLLTAAAEVIRELDPGATIVAFNTASGTPDRGQALKADGMFERLRYIGWRKFIRDVAAATGPTVFDAVGIHPYTQPESPENGGVVGGLRMLEEVAKEFGFAGKPVWFTEIGWPLEYPNRKQVRDERQQACFLIRLFGISAAHGVAQVQVMYMEDIVYSKDNTRRAFGMFLRPGVWREQAKALRVMLRLLPEPREGAKILSEESNGVFAYELPGVDGRPVLMAWNAGDGTVVREFPAPKGPLTRVDMLGNVTAVTAENGTLRLSLDEAPVYIVRADAAEVQRWLK